MLSNRCWSWATIQAALLGVIRMCSLYGPVGVGGAAAVQPTATMAAALTARTSRRRTLGRFIQTLLQVRTAAWPLTVLGRAKGRLKTVARRNIHPYTLVDDAVARRVHFTAP